MFTPLLKRDLATLRKYSLRSAALALIVAALAVSAREGLLRELVTPLRGSGVQVRTQWSEKTRSAPPKTPTLAPLRGFPARGGSEHRWQSFDDFFRAGAFEDAALIAVRGKARPKAKIAQEFPRLWRRAPPANRVFIAFSRRDAAAANAVRRALERKGYVCFTYIHGQTREPWANAVEVGRYFREAGAHLVIDSRAARASKGVRLEAHALAKPEKTKAARAAPPPAKQRRAGDPCCKVCYYLNGKLVGCDPVTCGPQCVNARGGSP